MKNVIRKVLYTGIRSDISLQLSRTVMLANAIAVIAIVLCSVLLLYMLGRNQWVWTLTTSMTFVTIVVLFLILVFNKLGQFNVSRFLLSILIPFISTFIVILPRIVDPGNFSYLPRNPGLFCVNLATSVVPLMVFSSREHRFMFTALGINLSILLFIDPALFVFSADYGTAEYGPGRYLANNVILIISEFFLIGCTIFLKTLFEYFEKENEFLIESMNEKNQELKVRNDELYQLNQEIEAQNQEIQAQSEELIQSQESLLLAHHEIERQNTQLEQSLDAKSKDLLHTNQQLVLQNHELQQFSYTVSHNLRGPVASMLGLINIHHFAKEEEEKAGILALMEKSAHSLETVIHDLNKIIDVRKDKFHITEKVNLGNEVALIVQSLSVFIAENDVNVHTDFKVPEITSVKAYINSILYNLISNAIQYRSPIRIPEIKISSYREGDQVVVEVSDNGLGIDLDRFRGDLFKLYKRFHTHIEGKGLGLYLVKQQVEKLNGRIEVSSQPDRGARFSIFIKEFGSTEPLSTPS